MENIAKEDTTVNNTIWKALLRRSTSDGSITKEKIAVGKHL
jgi:hypothetical protein